MEVLTLKTSLDVMSNVASFMYTGPQLFKKLWFFWREASNNERICGFCVNSHVSYIP